MITRQIIYQKLPPFICVYSPSFERLNTREVAKDGVLSITSIVEVYNPADEDKNVSYRDYVLRNILALNNPSLLNPVQMVETKINGISNLKNFNENVEKAVQEAQAK